MMASLHGEDALTHLQAMRGERVEGTLTWDAPDGERQVVAVDGWLDMAAKLQPGTVTIAIGDPDRNDGVVYNLPDEPTTEVMLERKV
jgi:hypothetical protein